MMTYKVCAVTEVPFDLYVKICDMPEFKTLKGARAAVNATLPHGTQVQIHQIYRANGKGTGIYRYMRHGECERSTQHTAKGESK